MNKLFCVTLTTSMIVLVFMLVLLFKLYGHDRAILDSCLTNTESCSSQTK